MKYEVRELGVLSERSRGNSHMEGCLTTARAAKDNTACRNCTFRDGPVQLAYQYTEKPFRSTQRRPESEKPANIVAVVPCKAGGPPVMVQVMGQGNPVHCARVRQLRSEAAA